MADLVALCLDGPLAGDLVPVDAPRGAIVPIVDGSKLWIYRVTGVTVEHLERGTVATLNFVGQGG